MHVLRNIYPALTACFLTLVCIFEIMPVNAAESQDKMWFESGGYRINLSLVEWFQPSASDIHVAGQTESIKNSWPGLEQKLSESNDFVKVGNYIVNTTNISIIMPQGPNDMRILFFDGKSITVPKDSISSLTAQAK